MNRMLLSTLRHLRKQILAVQAVYDRKYNPQSDSGVPRPKLVSRENWREYLYSHYARPGMRVLELGAAVETGENSLDRKLFSPAEYVGFDIRPDSNVDVVGDAHQASSYFDASERFDLIYSSACFEHFAMPWVVAAEMAKLVKVGVHVFIETHFTYPPHCRPCDYYRFFDLALKALFPESCGIRCVDSGMSGPIVGRWTALADAHLANRTVPGLFAFCARTH